MSAPLVLAGFELRGASVGGLETCIELPGLKLAFDIGRAQPSSIGLPTVLFTHAHMDHMGGVAAHAATRALRHMPPPTYLVPHECTSAFAELFEVWRRLDGSDLPHRLVPLGPGEEHELPCGLVARPFRALHRIPTQGYALWSRRRKLRDEFLELPGAEIARLRTRGVEVTRSEERAELACSGDTLIELVEREEVVRTARLLILECTFVDERVSVADCRAKGHTHLYEIAERAALFENEAILLTHFSARYEPWDVRAALDRVLPRELRERVTPWIAA